MSVYNALFDLPSEDLCITHYPVHSWLEDAIRIRRQVCRETDKEQVAKVYYDEGSASHTGP